MLSAIQSLLGKTKGGPKPKILIFAGAGVSQESGLATFRDAQGLWARHDLETVCNLRTFHKNRDLVFDFYNDRKKDIQAAQPNRAHEAICRFAQKMGPEIATVYTANVDDLFERAGFGYGNPQIRHVHGFINEMNCLDCGLRFDIGNAPFSKDARCPNPDCASFDVKPGIVLFREAAPMYGELIEAFQSSGVRLGNRLAPNYKLIAGTSFEVIPKEMMFLSRSETILLDPKPNLAKISESDFDAVIKKSACDGIDEALAMIEEDYRKALEG